MHIHPELRALRGHDAPQRKAQIALRDAWEAWRRDGPGAQVEAEVASFGRDVPVEDLPFLAMLFAPRDPGGRDFAAGLIDAFAPLLRAEPLSQVPLRYSSDEVVSAVMIVRHGATSLSLQAIDGTRLARKAPPTTIGFAAVETYEKVLSGRAEAAAVRIAAHRPGGADLRAREIVLEPGMSLHRTGRSETQQLRRVFGTLVTLKLQRRLSGSEVTREYDLADGRLVHQAAGSPRESRLELAAALLGRMGRSDAAPLLAAMAEEDGNPSLRWQALRECLGLDSALGFTTVCRLSQRADDPLAASARTLRAQLIDSYPQLAGVCQCPA